MYYTFGDCTLDTQCYEFTRAGRPISLRPKVFELLTYLLAQRDRVVSKDELLEHLWPQQCIGDAVLNSCLMAVRKAIGDDGQAQRCIHTRRGRGYRFVAPVEVQECPPDALRQAHSATGAAPTPMSDSPGAPGGPQPTAQLCPICQHPQPPIATFCAACGSRLTHPCAACGRAVRLPATVCPACGQRLPAPEPAHAPPPLVTPVPGQEYKQVTVFCGAVVEASALAVRLGPEATHHVMQVFFDLIQEVLQRYEGTLTQFEEGRCVAVFGAPVAQEDHAQRAVLAASDLLQRLRADRAWQSSVLGAAFAVGIGLHTGSVVGHRH